MKYERKTGNLLRNLGANNAYKGFRYTVYGTCCAIQDPELLTYITKGIYMEIAIHYHTSVECVERDIRTVVKTIWEHGDKSLLEMVFGIPLGKKPRSSAFIDALSHYVLEHYYD